MLKVKSLLDHTISPNEYEKNDKTILKYFQKLRNFFCEYTFKGLGWAKFIALFAKSINNLKSIRYIFFDKILLYYIICNNCGSEDEKIFKEEESIEILKILGLINNT